METFSIGGAIITGIIIFAILLSITLFLTLILYLIKVISAISRILKEWI